MTELSDHIPSSTPGGGKDHSDEISGLDVRVTYLESQVSALTVSLQAAINHINATDGNPLDPYVPPAAPSGPTGPVTGFLYHTAEGYIGITSIEEMQSGTLTHNEYHAGIATSNYNPNLQTMVRKGNTFVYAGGQTVRYSEDNGETWATAAIDEPFLNNILGIDISPSGRIIAVDYSGYSNYSDDGKTFTRGAHMGIAPYGVTYLDDNHIVAGCAGGVVCSTDGGDTWNIIALPQSNYVFDITKVSETEAFAQTLNGLVFHTTDAGVTWSRTVTNATDGGTGIFYHPSGILFNYGGSGCSFSTDKGVTWTKVPGGTYSALGLSSGIAVMIGDGGDGALVISDNGTASYLSNVLDPVNTSNYTMGLDLSASGGRVDGAVPTY